MLYFGLEGVTMLQIIKQILRGQKIILDYKNKRMEIFNMEGERTYINDYAPETVGLKTCVCVRAYFNKEGVIIPDLVIWEDGRRFTVDRIVEKRPAASLKGGGSGIRYTCRFGEKQAYLYLDENKWFVDKKRTL